MPVKLFYEEYGAGAPVVCIHGFPLDHTIWMSLVPLLETKARLILPDLRGHGRSPVVEDIYSMQDMAEDILLLLDDLKLEKVVLVGQSMGGYVALQFARSFPERLSGLALVASHPYADSPEQKKERLEMIEKVQRIGVATALETFPAKLCANTDIQEFTRAIIERTPAQGVVNSIHAMMEREDTAGVLLEAQYPAAIILGNDDPFISREIRQKMQIQFPFTQFTIIDGVAHMLMMEKSEDVSKILIHLIN